VNDSLSRLAKWSLTALAAVALALLMVRLLYTTGVGIRVVDVIPDAFWRWYHHVVGLNDVGDVEKVQNADGLIIGLGCLGLSIALVSAVRAALRRPGRTQVR
jgi:hypothetical protein